MAFLAGSKGSRYEGIIFDPVPPWVDTTPIQIDESCIDWGPELSADRETYARPFRATAIVSNPAERPPSSR